MTNLESKTFTCFGNQTLRVEPLQGGTPGLILFWMEAGPFQAASPNTVAGKLTQDSVRELRDHLTELLGEGPPPRLAVGTRVRVNDSTSRFDGLDGEVVTDDGGNDNILEIPYQVKVPGCGPDHGWFCSGQLEVLGSIERLAIGQLVRHVDGWYGRIEEDDSSELPYKVRYEHDTSDWQWCHRRELAKVKRLVSYEEEE